VVHQFFRDLISGRRWAPVLTTRSCDFKCQFCAVQITCGSKARSRSGRNVADEFEHLHKVYGYRDIFLQDAAFPVGSPLSTELCGQLLSRGLRINWSTNARADMVTPDSLRLIKEAGCSYLLYGMESGSPGILRNINKQESLEQIIEAIVRSHEAGIKVGVHILVGYPGENEETVAETIRVLRTVSKYIHTLYVRPLMVFPGTPLYQKVLGGGQLQEEDFYRPSRRFFIPYTSERSWETLNAWGRRIQDAVKPFNFMKRASDLMRTRGFFHRRGG
jgi:anaerobic magnesium-protoporphyrin IX monomethyl ester cyclase